MVKEAASGFFVRIPIDIEVADNETIFKTYDSKLMESLEIGIKKIPVKMSFKAKVGEPLMLLIDDGRIKSRSMQESSIRQRQNQFPKVR